MLQTTNSKPRNYDLEERTFQFARRVNSYINKLPRSISNAENGRQLTRAAGSIGANYIEANESLSKKDFVMRAKISKKETKECRFWLRLTEPVETERKEQELLIQEANELMRIFGAIIEKFK